MKIKLPRVITTSELQLGDTIRRVGHTMTPWDTTVVVQIKDGMVHLWRPYGHLADFSHTGGVIPYVGFETYSVGQRDSDQWTLYERKELR